MASKLYPISPIKLRLTDIQSILLLKYYGIRHIFVNELKRYRLTNCTLYNYNNCQNYIDPYQPPKCMSGVYYIRKKSWYLISIIMHIRQNFKLKFVSNTSLATKHEHYETLYCILPINLSWNILNKLVFNLF